MSSGGINIANRIVDGSPKPFAESYANIMVRIGLHTPFRRAMFFLGAVLAGQWLLQPKLLYSNGYARPWALLDKSNPEATILPWWIPPIAASLLGAFVL